MVHRASAVDPWPAWCALRRWPLWALPRGAALFIAFVVLVTNVAAGAEVAFSPRPPMATLGVTAVLVTLGVLYAELLAEVERSRERLLDSRSTWFAAAGGTVPWALAIALLAPAAAAAISISIVATYQYVRVQRPAGEPTWRAELARAALILGGWAARGAHAALTSEPGDGLPLFGGIAAAAVALLVVNRLVLTLGLALSAPHEPRWPRREDLRTFAADLALAGVGALLATTLTGPTPWLAVLLLPVLWYLRIGLAAGDEQRGAAEPVSELGLLSAAAWQRYARRRVHRARRGHEPVAVLQLVVDVDTLHAQCGSAAARRLLAAAGAALVAAVDSEDRVGMIDDGHYALVLACSVRELTAAAEEMADVVTRIAGDAGPRLHVVAGGGGFPDDGITLEELYDATTRALAVAHRSGVDDIALGATPDPTSGLAGYSAARNVAAGPGDPAWPGPGPGSALATPVAKDPRLKDLVELVLQVASGNLAARLESSRAQDEIDAVIVGINMLAEELQAALLAQAHFGKHPDGS